MVKPPKIRHSKARKEPVTIDLDPAEIVREQQAKADPANDRGAAKPYQAPATGSPEAKPAATPETPSSAASPFDEPAKGSATPAKAGEPTASSSKSQSETASHGFGRQPSPASASATASSSAAGKPSSAASSTAPPAPDSDKARTATSVPPPPARQRGGVSAIAAGIVGGVIALGVGYGLQAGGLLPGSRGDAATTPQTGASVADIEALKAEIATLREQQAATPPATAPDPAFGQLGGRVDALAASVEQLKAAPPPAAGTGDPAALDGLAQKVAALEASVATLSSNGGQGALDAVDAKLAALEQAIATQTAAAASANEAQAGLTSRLAAIEEKIASLGETVEGQPRMALAIAATALKAAVDRGDPFQAELDTYAAVAPDAAGIEPLRPLAADGVATRGQIESETEAAAIAMIDAARPVDQNAGLVDRLMSSAQSLVSVRPIGAVEGEGVPAIVARLEAAIQAGDYAKAVAEYETLPEPAKAAGADFIAKVKARQEADGLIETALSGALQPAVDAAPAPAAAPGPASNGG